MKRILLVVGFHDDDSMRQAVELEKVFEGFATVCPTRLPPTFFQENILWYIMQNIDVSQWDYIGTVPYQYMKKCKGYKVRISADECTGDCIAFLAHYADDLYKNMELAHGPELGAAWDALLSRVAPDLPTRPTVFKHNIYCNAFALKSSIFRDYINFMMTCLNHVDILNFPVYYNVASIPPERLGAMGCKGNAYSGLVFIAERLINYWLYYKNYSIQVVSCLIS